MPRYRFAWTNLSEKFLADLAEALGLRGDPVVALRSAYGARPKEVFVRDAWPFLREAWLAVDDEARQFVVEELQRLGLGDRSARLDKRDAQMAYLASCRNAPTLRQVVLSVFLVVGEQAPESGEQDSMVESAVEAAEQAPPVSMPTQPPPDEEGSVTLQQWVDQTLCEALGVDELRRDDDGDVPIPFGSSLVYVRLVDDKMPFVEIFAPLLSGFEWSPAVYEAVNQINCQLRTGRVVVVGQGKQIVLEAQLLAQSLSADELVFTLQFVGGAADHYDSLLQERFGGQTTFEDEEEGVDV